MIPRHDGWYSKANSCTIDIFSQVFADSVQGPIEQNIQYFVEVMILKAIIHKMLL